MEGRRISIGSQNCRGLQESLKRKDVFNKLKRDNLDICILLDTHCTEDQENKWKAEWGGEAKFASVDSNKRGVAILFQNTFEFVIHDVKRILKKDAIIIDISIGKMRISLVGIYGPNSDNPDFFSLLQEEIESLDNPSVMIMGDYNVVQSYLLDTYKYKKQNNPRARERLLTIMEENGYLDIWRERNPNRKLFTWKGPNSKRARLDYVLISPNLEPICKNVKITPGYRTDHDLVRLDLLLCNQIRGRGIWRFNNSLLRDPEYVRLVKNTIMETETLYKIGRNDEYNPENIQFAISDQLFFETLKLQIRGATIPFAARKKREENKRELDIENEIKKLHSSEIHTAESDDKLNRLNSELETMRENKMKGIIARAKVKGIKEGEKCTKYFCSLERRNYNEKLMFNLQNSEGETISKTSDIVNEQYKFYSNLYKVDPNVSDHHLDNFLTDENPYLNKLTEDERNECDSLLSYEECGKYLKQMKNNKSPGSDGFTTEFYKFFWADIGIYLFRSYKHSTEVGELSITQKQGVVTLLPKKDKSKLLLKNWRPISLLNTDYKIFSGALSLRLKKVMNKLIGETQKGFIEGRDISECSRLIYDILHATKKKNIVGILLLLDFEKAFDSLSHEFIDKTLQFFNFGPIFRKYIKLLFSNISSCMLYNGHCSSYFSIRRGCRQGDPISPYLFIISISTLAAALQFDPGINGIKVDNTEYILTQYADDTTLFLDSKEENINNVFSMLDQFASCSGLRVNVEKTKAVWMGRHPRNDRELCHNINISWVKDGKFEVLGLKYDLLQNDITESNFWEKLESIRKLLSTWSWRNLTIYGKITVIKSLAVPLLVHLFRALPNPGNDFYKEIDKVFYNFIWNGKPHKIKKNVLISSPEKGGANMIHLESFSRTMKIFWIRKLFNENEINQWKLLVTDELSKFGGNLMWNYHSDSLIKISNKNIFNPFWSNLIRIWAEIQSNNGRGDCLSEPLWFNPAIKVGNKTVFYKQWSEAGINYINDLLSDEGQLMDVNLFIQKYTMGNEYLRFFSIKSAIPNSWKQHIENNPKILDNTNSVALEKLMKNKQTNKKFFYNSLLEKIEENPEKAQLKWNSKVEVENFEEYYYIISKYLKDVTLKAFQYKIIHRILPTNKLLFKMRESHYSLCHFCGFHQETLEHLFFECMTVKNLWFRAQDTFLIKEKFTNFKLDLKTVMLGFVDPEERVMGINILLVLLKYYIFTTKLKGKELSFENARFYALNRIRTIRDTNLYDPEEWSFLRGWL